MARPATTRRYAFEAVPTTNTISHFTRVSKTHAFPDESHKKPTAGELTAPSRKRKASSIDQENESRLSRRNISFPPSSDEDEPVASKRTCRRAEPSPAIEAAADTIQVATPAAIKGRTGAKAATPRKQRAHRPSQATIIAKTVRQEKSKQTKISALYQRKSEQVKASGLDKSLPPKLADLLRLNKAFLNTMVMQIAHNGSNVPIDITTIAPQISRAWGKRQVTIEDIRRCIALQSLPKDDARSPFIISDYGRGRVCIELAAGIDGAAVSEERLSRQFEDNIRALCAEKATDEMTDVDVPLQGLSLSDLPQAAITEVGVGLKDNPLYRKGHRALVELKSGIVAKQQEKQQVKQPASNNPILNPDGTKMSLLDRIRAKQLAKTNSPLGPTGPELQRRAALNRVVDVAATISMLSLSNPISLPRQAFTMTVISEKLKDSLRVPLSKEESITCVKLIASEVAPEWLKVVAIGGRENVVIQRHSQPVDRVINDRVRRLLNT